MIQQRRRKGISMVAFRCWSRKAWAVFNSLHRIIKICTLCLTYNLVSPDSIEAQGINDSLNIKTHELGDVVVTTGRTPIEALQTARVVSVISKSEIERTPSQNLNDLLRYVSGVDLRQRGPFGAQADISIRGGTFDQTLILLNGINVTDPQTGHHNLNLPIDIESIERIEILKGPAAKTLGANAFSGAINIITGNSNQNHIRSSVMYGQLGLHKASANISNTAGNFNHFLSFSHIASGGYIKNTDFSNANIFYQATFSHKSGKFDFQTGYNAKDFGANSFYSLKYPDQFEATRTEFISLKYESNTKIKIAPTIYLRQNHDRFELKRDDNSVPFNHHRNGTAGLNLNLWANHLLGKTSLSIDFRNENIISNVLGNNLNIPLEVPGFNDVFYTKYYSRMNVSAYAEHSISLKMLTITSGIMTFRNSDMTGFGIYPGIDVNYRLKNQFWLYSSANKTMRMPTFTDLFYRSPVQQGNTELKPEEALTFEGGLGFNSSIFKGNAGVFHRRGRNMIDWIKNPSADSIFWRSMNHSKINFTGFEGSLTITPSREESVISSLQVSYSFMKADINPGSMLSKYVLDYLAGQINARLDLRVAWKLYNSMRLTWQNRTGVFQDATGQVLDYKSFWLSDTKFYWKESKFTLFAEASNIFNSQYYDFGGIIQPGFWLRGGVILDMDYKKIK